MDSLNVGVIGVGHLGQHHARLYHGSRDVRLVGVADIDPDRAALISQRYHVPAYTNLSFLLPQVQAVSIAVPTSAHYAVVKECLEAGVHVLVEKPIAVTVEETQGLIDRAAHKNLTLQVGHVERFNPVITAIHPYVRAPEYIECHRLSPFQPRGIDVDIVLDLMIHDLDLLCSFQVGPVQAIQAVGGAVLSTHFDVANARIMFENGCVANLTASRVAPERVRKLSLLQDDSYISVDYDSRQAMICPRVQEQAPLLPAHATPIQGGADEPLKLELEAFVHAVQTKTRPLVSGEEGLASMELAELILEAIHQHIQQGNKPLRL